MLSLASAARAICSTQRQHLLQFDLGAPLAPPAQGPRVRFHVATRHEVEQMDEDPRHEISPAGRRAHRDLMKAGAVCTLGLIDGLSVYHGWRTSRRWRIAGPREIALPGGTSIIFRCFTVREARGQGIYRTALTHELQTLKAEGARRALINVEVGNTISKHVIEKSGFQLLGTYRVTRIAGYIMVSLPEALRAEVLRPG